MSVFKHDVCIVGRGNVATALAMAFEKVGVDAATVSSRQLPEDISSLAPVTILAVTDDAIADVAGRIGHVDGIIAHTSGSVPLDALKVCNAKGWGVFYPLQTFSKHRYVDFSEIPILIETSDVDTETALKVLANRLTENVRYADSSQRAVLHLAAVFACNFTNALYTVSKGILGRANMPFEILDPLLHETLDKALAIGPENAQTGPAKRRDTAVINKHINALPDDLAQVYKMLTNLIYEQNKL